MSHATGVAEALLDLPGFRVLDPHESPAEIMVEIDTDEVRRTVAPAGEHHRQVAHDAPGIVG